MNFSTLLIGTILLIWADVNNIYVVRRENVILELALGKEYLLAF